MKVFVTGGTGFVGREIVGQLLAAGHTVVCLARPEAENKLTPTENLEVRRGDVTRPASLTGLLPDCDALIHLVGIIREHPKKGVTFEKLNFEATLNLIRAAESQGVRRFIHMSANGCSERADGGYFRTKYLAEKTLKKSALRWTIFRPSIIFGKGDAFTNLLGAVIRRSPVIPVAGGGNYRLAPVAVEDVAACFVKTLHLENSIGTTYHLCGPNEVTFNRLLDIIAETLNRKKPLKVPIPGSLVQFTAKLFQKIPLFPVTAEQVKMLLSGNICRDNQWPDIFGIRPRAFIPLNLGYLAR